MAGGDQSLLSGGTLRGRVVEGGTLYTGEFIHTGDMLQVTGELFISTIIQFNLCMYVYVVNRLENYSTELNDLWQLLCVTMSVLAYVDF